MQSYAKDLIEISYTMMQNMKKYAPERTIIGNKLGITRVQIMTLRFVSYNNECKTSDIAEFLLVSRSDATRIVDTLVHKGFIDRVYDKNDRRVIRLKITKEGKRVFEDIRKELITNFSEIIIKMEKEDSEALMRGMKALCDVLKETDQEKDEIKSGEGE